MRIDILDDARGLPLLGYIQQVNTPDIINSSVIEGSIIYDSEYIYPSINKKPYSNGTSLESLIFIPSNTAFRIITNLTRIIGTITFVTELDTLSSSSQSFTTTSIKNSVYSGALIKSPANVAYAILRFVTTNTNLRYAIYIEGMTYKFAGRKLYKYITKYPASDVDSLKIIDGNGNIYGTTKYIASVLDDHIIIESNYLKDFELYAVYDTDIGIYSYKEPIDPIPVSEELLFLKPEYAITSSIKTFDLMGNVPYAIKALILHNNYIIESDNNIRTAYAMSEIPTALVSKSGDSYINYSKIIKERAALYKTNVIKTKYPIKPSYTIKNNIYTPNRILDRTGTTTSIGYDLGLSIYLNDKLIDNDDIRRIHEDEGLIELKYTIQTPDIMVTYSTTPFKYLGTITTLGFSDYATIISVASDKYAMIINELSDISAISTDLISGGEISTTYYELLTGETLTYSSTSEDLDYLVFHVCGKGNFDIQVDEVTSTGTTTLDTDNITSATYVSRNTSVVAVSSDAVSHIITLTAIGDSEIHDFVLYYKSDTDGGVFFTTEMDLNETTVTDLFDSTNTQQIYSSNDYQIVANITYNTYETSSLYNYIEIDKRGGGLNSDDKIYKTTGYRRHNVIPYSYDYGDIATPYNRPFNPRKYLVITLPTSIISDLVTKAQRIDNTSDSAILRQDIINSIYKRIRETLPSGSYFRIYDTSNNPWPSEVVDD